MFEEIVGPVIINGTLVPPSFALIFPLSKGKLSVIISPVSHSLMIVIW